ncbi:MAG: methyltransferase [Bacteroidota bacterium]|nr:methyltransferase [Bacteroidota bacterium]
MSNTFFQFKQFTIHQGDCAMKVSTDACIQGAWAQVPSGCKRILDVGCGTGLLALMLAQRFSNCIIDAIEIDERAATQARRNIAESIFAKQINILHADALTYPFEHRYDFIICNPPFFSNSLKGPNNNRNLARHQQELTLSTLFTLFQKNTSSTAQVCILLPVDEFATFEHIASTHNWFVNKKLFIKPKDSKTANRVVAICSSVNTDCDQQELVIYNAVHAYTPLCKELLAPYYLHL